MKLTFENGHICIAYMDHPVVRRPVTLTDNLFGKCLRRMDVLGASSKSGTSTVSGEAGWR